MDGLFKKHRMYISQVTMDIIREMYDNINWNSQLVAIKGSRGVGKTTMIRQYIRQTYGVNAGEALYCVLDSMYFTNQLHNFHCNSNISIGNLALPYVMTVPFRWYPFSPLVIFSIVGKVRYEKSFRWLWSAGSCLSVSFLTVRCRRLCCVSIRGICLTAGIW